MDNPKHVDEYEHQEGDDEFYDWTLVPKMYPPEKKTGVTFKGDTEEYIAAHTLIFDMFNQKGAQYLVNGVEIRILDNAENKPIKVDVKHGKGQSGKVNNKMYKVNKLGFATMMISKTSDSKMNHVKILSFNVCRYLLGGIIDGEINKKDIENMKIEPKSSRMQLNSLYCDFCAKEFKTENGLSIHISNKHKSIEQKSELYLSEPMEIEIQNTKCTVCGKIFEGNENENLHLCHNKVWRNKCSDCEYKADSSFELKRHKRDEHGFWTRTISPQQKKRKQIPVNDGEKMDTNDLLDDEQVQLLERTKKQDEKVRNREKRLEEEEKLFKEKVRQENERKKKEEKEAKEFEKKTKSLKKTRAKNKERSLKKKRSTELSQENIVYSSFVMKPWLKPLPKNCKNVVGENFVLFPVKGDGACGPNSAAAWIHHDPSLGPFLARNININLVKNWEHYKDTITFPFRREVGNGKSVNFENENELFDFLIKDPESAYMWRGHEDFLAVASAYQIKITVITIRSEDDPNPTVNIIEPNPALALKSDITKGVVPDMILLHRENVHYDLIIPTNNRLAIEGGLDMQRQEASKNINNAENQNKKKAPEIDTTKALTEKIIFLEKECEKLKLENANLIKQLNKHTENHDVKSKSISESNQDEELFVLKRNKSIGYRRISPQVQSEVSRESTEYTCSLCGKTLENQKLLDAHKQSHIDPVKYPCSECEKEFIKQVQLDMHMKFNHSKLPATKQQYNCDECPFQGASSLELKKHVRITSHKPSAYTETCYTCKNEFPSYYDLMNHRTAEHPSQKECRYFLKGTCIWDEKCWYKHTIIAEANLEQLFPHTCQECEMSFKTQSEIVKHMKAHHRNSVPKCRDFTQGNCDLEEKSCSFLHEEQNMEVDQGFHYVREKTPPDQMNLMMNMLNKMKQEIESLKLIVKTN